MHLNKVNKIIHKYFAQIYCPQNFIVKKTPRFKNFAEF